MAVGGIPEVISDGVDGLLVPPGDLARFAESLAALLGDPARRAAMGVAAVTKVRDGFLFDARMARMVAIYEAGLARPGMPAPAAGSTA
jgi:glycosyltransferase involved in cell wall biosynthesis